MEHATQHSASVAGPALLWDTFEFLERRVLIGTGDETTRLAVHAMLGAFGPIAGVRGDRLPRYSLARRDGGWQIVLEDKPLDPFPDFLSALSNLEWHIVDGALSQRTDLFQMHAGALSLPSRRAGLVLAGASGSGKTTLTMALMLRGFAPFSDDVTIVSPEGLELMPFPRAFHIEEQTWQLLEPVAGTLLRTDPDMPAGYFCPPQWAHRPVPVRWVVFPEYQQGRTPQLTPMTRAHAAAALVSNSGTLHRDSRLALRTAVRIAEQVPCYRFACGDLAASVSLLQQLVDQPDAL